MNCIRTDSSNKDFQNLVKELDAYLAIVDGKEHDFYNQYNKIDSIKYAVVIYDGDEPVGCGAIKEYAEGIMEVKRMYVPEDKRGRGIASMVLKELEKWAKELKMEKCILETGHRQVEAVRLYMKSGYKVISNYGQYAGVENSVCFEKNL